MGFVSDWVEQAYVIGDDDSRLRMARRARAKAMPIDEAFALAADRRLPRRWYVAAARDENRAADRLGARGVELWQPRRKVTIGRRRGLAARDVERPLFPGYLFLHVPAAAEAFHAVNTETDGLLGARGWPEALADGVIETLRLANDAGAFDDTCVRRRAKLERALIAGAEVMVKSGPLAGVLARVAEGWKGGAVARLEAELFGGLTLVSVRLDELREVE